MDSLRKGLIQPGACLKCNFQITSNIISSEKQWCLLLGPQVGTPNLGPLVDDPNDFPSGTFKRQTFV